MSEAPHSSVTTTETDQTPAPTVTPVEERRDTCPHARFGRPHTWATGAFYWPLGSPDARLYVGDDYVMCGGCGQIEEDFDVVLPPATTSTRENSHG